MGKSGPTILVADDHPVVLAGLRSVVEGHNGCRIVSEVSDGLAAVEECGRLRPDVALLDLSMPVMNGIEAARKLGDASPETRVIIMSVHAEARFVLSALEAGATGFLLKEQLADAFIEAIEVVSGGGVYLAPAVAGAVLAATREKLRGSDEEEAEENEKLTAREQQVLWFVAQGRSTKQIADRLGVSAKTISTHRQNIMDKLGIHNAAGLTRYVIEHDRTDSDAEVPGNDPDHLV